MERKIIKAIQNAIILFIVFDYAYAQIQFQKVFDYAEGDNEGIVAIQTFDGGYVIAARTTSYGLGQLDIYLIKTDANGNSGCNTFTPSTIVNPINLNVSSGGIVLSGATENNPSTASAIPTTQERCLCTMSISSTTTNVTCNGGNDGAINITVTGGNPPYSYMWSNGAPTKDISGLTAGTYSVTVTDRSCCFTTGSFTITEPTPISSTTNSSTLLCNGQCNGTTSITSSGGTGAHTYLWNDPNSQTAAAATGLCAGAYTVTVTDANSCSVTASAIVSQPAALSISVAVTNETCAGKKDGAATASATGGTSPYVFDWINPACTDPNCLPLVFPPSPTATDLAAGAYLVIVSDANGCASSQSVTISTTFNITTAITASNATCAGICNGSATAAASGGTTPYTYGWSNGASGATATALCAGNYSVGVIDANGCARTASVTITQPPPNGFISGFQNISCNASSDGMTGVSPSNNVTFFCT